MLVLTYLSLYFVHILKIGFRFDEMVHFCLSLTLSHSCSSLFFNSVKDDETMDSNAYKAEMQNLQIANRKFDATRRFYAAGNSFLMLKYRLDIDKLKSKSQSTTDSLDMETRVVTTLSPPSSFLSCLLLLLAASSHCPALF
jgi:hypothetical protein